MYVLSGTDMHRENLIASGAHPFAIDLETLFQPQLKNDPEETAEELALKILKDPVLEAGLLPTPYRADGLIVDRSAVGAVANQETPLEAEGWLDFENDQATKVAVRARVGEISSQPIYNGERIDSNDYRKNLQCGFKLAYKFLLSAREELLVPAGPLSLTSHLNTRLVARPSAFYASLLNDSAHPKTLRSGLQRDFLFLNLWQGLEFKAELKSLTNSERVQLWQGDVPCFSAQVGGYQRSWWRRKCFAWCSR